MGNGQSQDEFAGVLPSTPDTKVSAEPAPSNSQDPISEAWTIPTAEQDQQPAATVANTSLLIGKIKTPGHALQQEETRDQAPDKVEDRFLIPESVRKSRTMDGFADVCSEILPGLLYVSNLRVAQDSAKLRALGITHVVNCCGELQHFEEGSAERSVVEPEDQILRLLLRDDANEDLTPFLSQVVEYIASCKQKGCKVLVHCHQGISRSCAFAVAYVMLERRLSYREAAAFVKNKRAISSPNAAFICQLLEWEKDLQVIASSSYGDSISGLYRLTPHASYDPYYFVLKRCYDPNLGSARQRQNLATVKTREDKQRLLWRRGAFCFQNPSNQAEVIVWIGTDCVIPDAATAVVKHAEQLLRIQALAQTSHTAGVKIVCVKESQFEHPGTDIDHFGYAVELQWSQNSALQMARTDLATNGDSSQEKQSVNTSSGSPKLFILDSMPEDGNKVMWDQLTNYDSEDLVSDSAFLLCSVRSHRLQEGYVWLGENCKFPTEKVVVAAQIQTNRVAGLTSTTTNGNLSASEPLKIEFQNKESDEFWKLFEAGY